MVCFILDLGTAFRVPWFYFWEVLYTMQSQSNPIEQGNVPAVEQRSESDILDYFFAKSEDMLQAIRSGEFFAEPGCPSRSFSSGRTDMKAIHASQDLLACLLLVALFSAVIGAWGAAYVSLKALAPLIRRVRRPTYYPLENAKREYLRRRNREIARKKAMVSVVAHGIGHGRMVRVRHSLNPVPTRSELEAQWERAKGRKPVEEKIRLGAMLAALETSVDNALLRDDFGNICGRNPGLRGWLKQFCPKLADHYKTLMRYKGLADKMQEVYGVEDPMPATLLIEPSRNMEGKAIYKGVYEVENSGGTERIGIWEVSHEVAERVRERRAEAREMLAGPCGETAKALEMSLVRALTPQPSAYRRPQSRMRLRKTAMVTSLIQCR